MIPTEQAIREFSLNPTNTDEGLAFLKVGVEKKEDPAVIMSKVIANALLRFHGIYINRK